jgi:TPR repeat protein
LTAGSVVAFAALGLALTRYPGEAGRVTHVRALAILGDRDAAFDLANRLFTGNGVTCDVLRAEHWFSRAAQGGHPEAMYRLAPSVDDVEAARLYRDAAAIGHAESMNALGVCLALGRGTERNYRSAVVWFRRACAEWDQVPVEEFRSYMPRDLRPDEDREEVFLSADPMTNMAWLLEREGSAGEAVAADLYRKSLMRSQNWLARSRLNSLLMRRSGFRLPIDSILVDSQ